MKIALIIQHADRRRGGAEQYTLDLARSLGGAGGLGHAVTVVAEGGPQEVADGAAAAGFKCVYLGAKGRLRWPRLQDFLLRVKELYEGGAYEIVHAMLPVWRCDVYQPHSGLAAELVARGHMKHPGAVVQKFSWMANHMNWKRVGLARMEAKMMAPDGAAAPWILCSSSQMQQFARQQFPALPASHLISAMNGIDLNYFDPAHGIASRKAIREEWGIEKEQRLGVLVGNNWKLKGVQEAIEALALAKDPRLVVMIVGRDDAAGYKKQAQRLGIAERVKFVGRVGDLRTLYGAADFMLLPTRRDTCSLVVLEGLAMGLPVITTLQNGASDVIENGRQGILLERGDPVKLAEAMRAMLENERLKSMAREATAMRFTLSLEHHVEKIAAVYRRVVETRRNHEDAKHTK